MALNHPRHHVRINSRDTYGAHLEQMAERTAAAVDTFVLRRIIDVSLLARVPEVREAAVAGGRTPFNAEKVRPPGFSVTWRRTRRSTASCC